jgi:predicted DNA-binding transcriptional regulator AlpA
MEPLLDAKEVKKILRCSLPLVYKLADRGQIPCIRVPCPGIGKERTRTMVRFKKSDVLSFIEKHYRPSDCKSGRYDD